MWGIASHPLPQFSVLKLDNLDIMICVQNPRTLKFKTGGSQVQGQPGTHNEILSKKERQTDGVREDGELIGLLGSTKDSFEVIQSHNGN